MIQQQHIVNPHAKPEVGSGKKITLPGYGVNIKEAIEQYSRGSMENKAKGFYENEGEPVPDFAKMSKIERLEALGEYIKEVENKRAEIANIVSASQSKQKDAILQQTVKQKVQDELKQQRSERNDPGGKG